MSNTISYLFTTAITLSVLFTLSADLVASYGKVTASWAETQERWQAKNHTVINGPTGQWAGAEPTVELTIANIGKVALEQFADWDVVFEIQRSPGLGVQYLSYTTSTPLGTNEWTVDAIYRDAATLATETIGPGILDPGEEMVVVAKPNPAVVLGTYDRATFSTPSGATAEIIFEIVVTPTPTP